MDKFSFGQDELALVVETCTLDIKVSGMLQKKQFVVVGTAISKGEDVTCRGKVILVSCTLLDDRPFQIHIFEIIDVIPEPGRPETNHKLKALKAEEVRGPVSAICALEGHLVVGFGTKVGLQWCLEFFTA